MALDEGLIPWWYGEGGWAEPTAELLTELGIDADTPIQSLRENEAFLAYQDRLMRDRIEEGNRPAKGRGQGRSGEALEL